MPCGRGPCGGRSARSPPSAMTKDQLVLALAQLRHGKYRFSAPRPARRPAGMKPLWRGGCPPGRLVRLTSFLALEKHHRSFGINGFDLSGANIGPGQRARVPGNGGLFALVGGGLMLT